MPWIPGWNSVPGAHWGESFFFWAGIIALVLLGISEVISHRYSERKDQLTTVEQAETQRRHDEEMARLHLQAATLEHEAAVSNARAKDAELEIERLRELARINAAPRVPNADLFEKQLAGISRQSVDLLYDKGVPDASTLATIMGIAFLKAGWKVERGNKLGASLPANLLPWSSLPFEVKGQSNFWGISIISNKSVKDDPKDPRQAVAQAIFKSGAEHLISFGVDATLPDGTIRIVIGPRTPLLPAPSSKENKETPANK